VSEARHSAHTPQQPATQARTCTTTGLLSTVTRRAASWGVCRQRGRRTACPASACWCAPTARPRIAAMCVCRPTRRTTLDCAACGGQRFLGARATLASSGTGALPAEPFTLEQRAASSPPSSPSSSTEAITTGASARPGASCRLQPPPLTPPPRQGFGSNDPLSDTSTVTWAAMSAIFEGYEKELQELSSSITRKAAQIPTLTRGACSEAALARSAAAPAHGRRWRGTGAAWRGRRTRGEAFVVQGEACVRPPA
jgi:hypothetical protein